MSDEKVDQISAAFDHIERRAEARAWDGYVTAMLGHFSVSDDYVSRICSKADQILAERRKRFDGAA